VELQPVTPFCLGIIADRRCLVLVVGLVHPPRCAISDQGDVAHQRRREQAIVLPYLDPQAKQRKYSAQKKLFHTRTLI
jgi:hypothetical protein